jgi:hypothetical protein
VTDWLIEGLIPAGAIVTIADLDDPTPEELLARGFDVVIYLHGRGAMDGGPVLQSVHWRDGLAPGHEPPAPFWIQLVGGSFERVDVNGDAA